MYAFRYTYQRLLGGFIYSTKDEMIRFINPSLVDFLLKYIRLDNVEVEKIASSVIDVDQLTKRLFSLAYSGIKPIMPNNLQNRLLNSYKSFLSGNNNDAELIVLALVIYKYIDSKEKDIIICQILNSIDEWDSLYEDYEISINFQKFMSEVRDNYAINTIIEERITDIINELVLSDSDIDGAYGILLDLVTKYDVNLELFDTNELDNHFAEILQEYILTEVESLKEFITDENEVTELTDKVISKLNMINKLGLNIKLDLREITNIDWDELAWFNGHRIPMEKDD